jgi:hypothetical protein
MKIHIKINKYFYFRQKKFIYNINYFDIYNSKLFYYIIFIFYSLLIKKFISNYI